MGNPSPARKKIPSAARALVNARDSLPRRDERRLRVDPALITAKTQFTSTIGGKDLTKEDTDFGAAMHRYLAQRRRSAWTCGEVLDVLLDLGYVNATRDFQMCVQRFTTAIEAFKRGTKKTRRKFLSWSEVRAVAATCGWRQRGKRRGKIV